MAVQVGDLATEVELELAGGPKAAFSRDLVIFWSAAGDLKSPPKVACVD
jgi:hypothetical protein